jgi:hypothetical protein
LFTKAVAGGKFYHAFNYWRPIELPGSSNVKAGCAVAAGIKNISTSIV